MFNYIDSITRDPTGTTDLTVVSECSQGSYCEEGSALPTSCEIGTFNLNVNSASADDCKPCPEGFYCEIRNNATQTECDDGFYCRSGSFSARPGCSDKQAGRGEVCPLGFTCDSGLKTKCPEKGMCSKFAQNAAEIEDCIEGYYCPEGTVIDLADEVEFDETAGLIRGPSKCEKEGRGVYCPANVSAPVECPVGEWSDSVGSKDSGIDNSLTGTVRPCIPCPEGRACTSTGINNVTSALQCSAGYFCEKVKDSKTTF